MLKTLKLERNGDWLAGVRQQLSPNRDARPDPADINLLVIHGISLPPEQYGGGYVERLFLNTLDPDEHPYFAGIVGKPVSAHVFIDREGAVTQYVPFSERAWHAGQSEFNGKTCCNDFSIGIELEGSDNDPYTDVQYDQLAAITRLLQAQWPAIEKQHIVGHCHIAPGRKTDPGPSFDWDHYYSLLA